MKKKYIITVALVVVIAIGAFILIKASTNSKKSVTQPDKYFSLKIDFDQDLTKLSLMDLRVLKSLLYMKYDSVNINPDLWWYIRTVGKIQDTLRYIWYKKYEQKTVPVLKFTDKEKIFISKIEDEISERLKRNYQVKNGRTRINMDNIVNLIQLDSFSNEFIKKITQNHFIIVPGNDLQLFDVYEKNDYRDFPSFITTDLFLQTYHMYFKTILETVEKEHLIPTISSLANKMYDACSEFAKSPDPEIKSVAEYDLTYFAIALKLLNDKNPIVPESMISMYQNELSNIMKETDRRSDFLSLDISFDYSLFKPRGHYSKEPVMQRYFRSMVWLQTAPMCISNDPTLKRALLIAYILSRKENKSLLNLYKSFYEPVAYLCGKADNISVSDLTTFLSKLNISDLSQLYSSSNINKVRNEILLEY